MVKLGLLAEISVKIFIYKLNDLCLGYLDKCKISLEINFANVQIMLEITHYKMNGISKITTEIISISEETLILCQFATQRKVSQSKQF